MRDAGSFVGVDIVQSIEHCQFWVCRDFVGVGADFFCVRIKSGDFYCEIFRFFFHPVAIWLLILVVLLW